MAACRAPAAVVLLLVGLAVTPAAEGLSSKEAEPAVTAHLAASSRSSTAGGASPVSSQISAGCQEELRSLHGAKRQADAAACEKEHGFPSLVIGHLQARRQGEAVAVTQKSFETCGGLSSACALEVAPGVVQELRFSGVVMSEHCRASVNAAQKNPNSTKVHACEEREHVAEGILGALNKAKLDAAVSVAEGALLKCMGLTEECAFQVAPVLVNQMVTMAVMQTDGMMPVLVESNLQAANVAKKATTSLLRMAIDSRQSRWIPARSSRKGHVFLQRSAYRVNRLILALARQES